MTVTQRLAAARMLQPLRQRDYALLVTGSVVSLLGDGFFYVALAWQVYSISNVPTAMALVGAAGTLPFVIFLLVGGAFSDRYDRRRLMIASDIVRAATVGGMALLSVTGSLELWHVAVLISVQSAAAAFFFPASSAILPDLVADERLTAANSLAGMYRPLMLRIVGPAFAGFVIAIAGPGPAFAVDSASFLVSALAVALIRTRRQTAAPAGHGLRRTITEVREGLGFARSTPWIWATLVAAMLSLLVFVGPVEVLLPYLVKNKLGLGADSLGLIFAAGGVGAIGVSLIVGSRGMPRRRITTMYAVWSLGVLVIALFGLMTDLWQALVISLAIQGLFTAGSIIWETLLQQLVPRRLLGRVSSLDWLVSTGLVPVSYVLTAPAADWLGPEATIVLAGVIGAVLMGMLLFVPGVRDPERIASAPAASSLDGSTAR